MKETPYIDPPFPPPPLLENPGNFIPPVLKHKFGNELEWKNEFDNIF